MDNKYPLNWPLGFARTHSYSRKQSRFDQTASSAQNYLKTELKRLGASKVVVTSNVKLRLDGFAYATEINKKHDDPGVAVYFKYDDCDVCLCCDKWSFVWENMYAVARTVYALRQIERDGVSDFLKSSFKGFTALPTSNTISWQEVLQVQNVKNLTIEDCKNQYRVLVKQYHPDSGTVNDSQQFIKVCEAWGAAKNHFKTN